MRLVHVIILTVLKKVLAVLSSFILVFLFNQLCLWWSYDILEGTPYLESESWEVPTRDFTYWMYAIWIVVVAAYLLKKEEKNFIRMTIFIISTIAIFLILASLVKKFYL